MQETLVGERESKTQKGRKKIKGVLLNKFPQWARRAQVPLRNPRRQCRPRLGHPSQGKRSLFSHAQPSWSEASEALALPALQAAPRVQVQRKPDRE